MRSGSNTIVFIILNGMMMVTCVGFAIVLMKYKTNPYYKDIDIMQPSTARRTAAIVFTTITCIIGLVGTIGLIIDTDYLLIIYFTGILTLLVISVGALIYQLTLCMDEEQYIADVILQHYAAYDKNVTSKALIDKIQSSLKCCGPQSKWDFIFDIQSFIPGSCCGKLKLCDKDEVDDTVGGCISAIAQYRKPVETMIYMGTASIAALLILASVRSCVS